MWERNREGSGGRELKAAQYTNRKPPQLLPGNNTCRGDGAFAEGLSCFIWVDVICSSEEELNSLFTREATEAILPHLPHCTTAREHEAGLESGHISSHPNH